MIIGEVIAETVETAGRACGRQSKEEVRIVLVDDDRDTCTTLRELLESDGYSVRIALNAGDALKLIEDYRPICALIDLGLPGTDGCELARQLRARHGQDLVLIAVTGWSQRS
ncbi:MAG: response regulator [Burkholderiaceae bacterium]